ncbi:class II aaRS and biotin synthetase [Tuber magnatum]|uniref:Class II aaRS and biotin synthetase n=1 Tax=Tuber magnatum TaxID=42249 RepID=A0A317ST72_9PEZI|nr:class II aaRS and biotin synthetase [Tuber magnatum]
MDTTDNGEFVMKAPRGTRDWFGKDIIIRDKIISSMVEVFKRHGAATIDIPVFELLNPTISGQDKSPICKLADQGGQLSALRYFPRRLAHEMAGATRHLVTDGSGRSVVEERMRCHFGVVGVSDGLLAEAEVLRVTMEILDGLKLGAYTIKIKHSLILRGILEVCQVPDKLLRGLAGAINNISKKSLDEVYLEMTADLGIRKAMADKLGSYVAKTGGTHLLYDLLLDEELTKNATFSKGINEMKNFFDFLEIFGVMPKIAVDLSLAGPDFLDLGLVCEVVTPPHPIKSTGKTIDSAEIASGAGCFRRNGHLHKATFPITVIEFELEDIFEIIQARFPADKVRETEVDAYVMAVDGGFLMERLQAEFLYNEMPEPTSRFAVVLSEEEIKEGKVKIKEVSNPRDRGLDVDIDNVGLVLGKVIKESRECASDRGGAGTEEEGNGDRNFRERMDTVRAQGGNVEMEGVNFEMDFARIKVKDAEIQLEGAKIDMKKVRVEIRGSKKR